MGLIIIIISFSIIFVLFSLYFINIKTKKYNEYYSKVEKFIGELNNIKTVDDCIKLKNELSDSSNVFIPDFAIIDSVKSILEKIERKDNKNTIKLWYAVGKNKKEKSYFYVNRPYRLNDRWVTQFDKIEISNIGIKKEFLPKLSWNDEPIEIELEILIKKVK